LRDRQAGKKITDRLSGQIESYGLIGFSEISRLSAVGLLA
jgi:hypothetical protein